MGDLCAQHLDAAGKRIPLRLGISGGATKVAMLRGGWLNALVTDEIAATGILEQT